jgi:hypothetical protein
MARSDRLKDHGGGVREPLAVWHTATIPYVVIYFKPDFGSQLAFVPVWKQILSGRNSYGDGGDRKKSRKDKDYRADCRSAADWESAAAHRNNAILPYFRGFRSYKFTILFTKVDWTR